MRTILTRLLLLLAVAGFAVAAQEAANQATEGQARVAEIDALEPGLSSQDKSAAREAIEPGLSSRDKSGAREAIEPGLSSRDKSGAREAIEPNLSSTSLSVAGQRTESTVAAASPAQEVRRRVANNGVMDEIYLARTEITGNQELPKVLYIVPWQKSDPGDLTGKPINTLLDEVLAPIDRSEFIRQIDYYGDLYGKEER